MRLAKYLAKSANAELQMGAVSGLVDVEEPAATALLVKALPDLTAGNRKLAVAGLLRTPARAAALLDALEKGTTKADWLAAEHRDALLKHPDEAVRTRRTIKAYDPAPVDRGTLDELFDLARWAPNHNLTNPWRFRVVGPQSPVST